MGPRMTHRTPDLPLPAVSAKELGQRLSDEQYLRERTAPRFSHLDYLQLKDIYTLLSRKAGGFRGDVFDYGCGGAPYRGLFAECRRYIKADVTPSPVVDRLLTSDGRTEEPDASYDWVISTQVLEHVARPAAYVAECLRLLRPGGQLLLSTHGFVHEHGCPYDFHRWTCRGLEQLIMDAGFEVVESGKVTAGVRGVIQVSHQLVTHLRADGRPWLHYPLAVFRRLYSRLALPVLNRFAELFAREALVPATHPTTLYVGIYVHARKPGALCD
jgi:SAM-dependent methyltransferase